MNQQTKQSIIELVDKARERIEEDIRKLDEIIEGIAYEEDVEGEINNETIKNFQDNVYGFNYTDKDKCEEMRNKEKPKERIKNKYETN